MVHLPSRRIRRSMLAVLVSSSTLAGLLIGITESPAAAAVTSVKGSACSYYVNVGLFGGPQTLKGCGQAESIPPTSDQNASRAATVALPANGSGSASAITASDPDGAKAQYGPAVIHGGIWPENVQSPTASGPQLASTQGTPAGGTVTSSADITLKTPPYPVVTCAAGFSPPCTDPGGFGPPPVWGDSVHVQCSASATAVSGSTTFSNAFLAHATDSGGSPLPSATEAIPNNPPANFTLSGVITNVGDVFAAVFNQQIVNPDGSLTVNGMHMYLFGPTAIGEMVRGQATCGTNPHPAVPADTVAPTCGTTVVEPVAPDDPTPKSPRTELIGVFDAGTGAAPTGLQSITNIQVTNGTVDVGNPDPNYPAYTHFSPGQTGPLAVTATRTDAADAAGLPMIWSFDATDAANNTTHCHGLHSSNPAPLPADFDGNGTTDISVFRPSVGQWLIQNQPSVFLGLNGDVPVPCNYNGGATAVPAVFRPGVGGWYVQGQNPVFFGLNGDIPVPGDYNGDGKCDIAVFRPSVGGWYIMGQNPIFYGLNGDIPVPGDYDGSGSTGIAVFRPSVGGWYVRGRPTVFFGLNGDIPVPGDYNGNGNTDIAVFRPSVGGWYLNGGSTTFLGLSGDVPVPGNYNGDSTTDIAVYRQSTGTWFLQGGAATNYGLSSDIALPLPSGIRQAFFP